MTRMERRRRRRRILRIKLATTAAVLALTTASIVALTGGAAETVPEQTPQPPALQAEPVLLVAEHDSTYQPVQMTAEPAQEPEPVEEEDENEKIEAALLEQGYQPVRPHDAQLGKAERVDEATRARWRVCCHGRHPSVGDAEDEAGGRRGS